MKRKQVILKGSDKSNNKSSSSSTSSSSSSSSDVQCVRYSECQKNHAASIGGYAVDGCREFMASGRQGSSDAFTCAACGCHRNFHRREVQQTEVVCEYIPPNYNPR